MQIKLAVTNNVKPAALDKDNTELTNNNPATSLAPEARQRPSGEVLYINSLKKERELIISEVKKLYNIVQGWAKYKDNELLGRATVLTPISESLKARTEILKHNVEKVPQPETSPSDKNSAIPAKEGRAVVKEGRASSSWEIYEHLAESVGSMGEEYLDIFQQAVEKNAAFYSDFSDFLSHFKEYVDCESSNEIDLLPGFAKELDELIKKYAVPGILTTLYPPQNGDKLAGATKEKCEAWAQEMGLDPDKCVMENPDEPGTYIVHIDTGPLQNIADTVKDCWFPGGLGGWGAGWLLPIRFSSFKWAAWQSGLDMNKDSIQTGMQTLTQKYSNANSTFDNLVKVLSSTIASLQECDKGFLTI